MTKPTIGIEIELPWQHMLDRVDPEAGELFRASSSFWALPDAEKARVQQGFNAVDAEYKERVDEIFNNYSQDVFDGYDGYVEFALHPKAEAEELVVVTKRLFDADLLREDGTYSLHATLGGVKCSRTAWLVLMAAEVSGGTTPERLAQRGTWEQKGDAGVKARRPAEMTLNANHGFELRTLALRGLQGLSKTLHVVQSGGELLARRDSGDDEARRTLCSLYKHLVAGMIQKDMDASVDWKNPCKDPDIWQKFSDALRDSDWQQSMEKGVLELL